MYRQDIKVENATAPESGRLRKADLVDYLRPMCVKWLRSLPEQVRPTAVANQYPRIANLLALEWTNPAACRRYFHRFLIDGRRGNRQGFPLDVHRELKILRDYYHSQHPGN